MCRSDLKAARRFYGAALGAIGMKINIDVSSAFGMGSRGEKVFWLARNRHASGGGHYAFRVDHREEVDAFYQRRVGAGGKDNGKPGLRPTTVRATARFVKDSEGNKMRSSATRGAGRGSPRPQGPRRRRGVSPGPGLWTMRCATSAASPGATHFCEAP